MTNEQIASCAAMVGLCPPHVSYAKAIEFARSIERLCGRMGRDELLRYYSNYANVCAQEALLYQKRIRDLEAALANLSPIRMN